MHFVFEVEQFLLKIIRFVFSNLAGKNNCIICGKNSFYIPVCSACSSLYFSVQKDWSDRCLFCGKKLLSLYNRCMKCRSEKLLVHTDRLFPLFSYRLWNKTLMFDWKISGNRCISAFFAEKINCFFSDKSNVVIVPVPPRKGKIRKKGWDQIDELARFLRWRYGFCILKILQRLSTQEQKKLDREERIGRINNSYCMTSPRKLKRILKPFMGKIPEEVWLLDDVSTTGATIESCSYVLKSAGVKKVYAVTLFTVD